MSSPITKSIKESYNKTSLPTPSPSALSSTSVSSTMSSSSILFNNKKNSYKSISSPTSPESSTSNKKSTETKNDDTSDIISKLSNKAKINGTKILKQPLSNSKTKNHKPIKINIKDKLQNSNTNDKSLVTPSSNENESKSVKSNFPSLKDRYSNTYTLTPYIVTDVDLNNIDFDLNINGNKSNSNTGKKYIIY